MTLVIWPVVPPVGISLSPDADARPCGPDANNPPEKPVKTELRLEPGETGLLPGWPGKALGFCPDGYPLPCCPVGPPANAFPDVPGRYPLPACPFGPMFPVGPPANAFPSAP